MKIIVRILQWVVLIVSVAYTAGYLGWRGLLLSPLYESSWQLQVSEVFWAWFYLPLIPLLLIVLLTRTWRALFVLAIPVLFFSWEYGARFLPNWQHGLMQPTVHAQTNLNQQDGAVQQGKDSSKNNAPLRVMTWNSFRSFSVQDDLARILREEQPDIVTFQEVSGGLRRSLKEDFLELYPYQYHQPYGSLATISRYPLSSPTHDKLMQMGCRCLPLEIIWQERAITVVNIHIPRPAVFYTLGGGIPQITTFDPRSQELHYKVLFKLLDAIETPVILQGDINTTEMQPNFRRLSQTLQDSFAEVGWGMGFTYPHVSKTAPRWLVPLVQIDHIMHSQELVALMAQTGELTGSDHLYVTATLRWR